MKFFTLLKQYPQSFWVANIMELFERWAWYGMFMVFALYLTGSVDTGALGFSQTQKGLMMGIVVGMLYFMPVITGTIADRVGYKKILIISYIILASSYFLLGQVTSYFAVFSIFIMLAIGAALFKPVITASIVKTTDKKTASVGFGLFYMMVNIGAFIGPISAALLRQISWTYVFNMASIVILFNLIIVILFYKEPSKEIKKKESMGKEIKQLLLNIYEAVRDIKFSIFLIIVIGFWTMYNQLFYTLPIFIDQWMDTRDLFLVIENISPWIANTLGTDKGTIPAEILTNLDAMYIIIFQILISYIVMKFKPLHSMIAGFFVNTIGLVLTFMTNNPMFLFISILIFGLGEMACSPKITEYIGRIAPAGKTALYMGSSFLPMAGGNFFAGIISGSVYQNKSDKISLLQREIEKRGLEIPEITSNFSQNDYFQRAQELLNMDYWQLTNFLWDTYSPGNIWIIFATIGISSVIALVLYDKYLLKSK
jgi:proton-dependent oligopeptide transporter, POT family